MPADTLTARANTGTGTDPLAGRNTAQGFVGAVMLTDAAGADIAGANPLPVAASALPLPSGAATETTLAALNTKTPLLGQAAMAASQPVVISSDQTTIPVNQAGVSATGSLGALNAAVALALNGASGWAVDLRGSFVATVTFQGTIDGTNWFTIAVLPAGSGVNAAQVTTATAAGAWWGNATGLQQVRAIATAFTSGSVTVVVRAMQAAGVVMALPSGQTTVAVAGTVTANVSGTGITGGVISPLTVAGASAEASSAKTASGNSASALTNASGRNAHFFVNVSASSGTTPTLVVRVQVQDPVSTTWIDLPGAATASITGNGLTLLTVTNLPRTYRLAWTIGGTTPSFTFSVGIAPVI